MAEPVCEIEGCTARVYNFCGACGIGTCGDHSIENDAYE